MHRILISIRQRSLYQLNDLFPYKAISHIVLWLLFCSAPLQAEEINCHLHGPDGYRALDSKALIIPNVGNAEACELINQQRFSSKGKCHCLTSGIGTRKFVPTERPQPGLMASEPFFK
jgi:hypothetical protein